MDNRAREERRRYPRHRLPAVMAIEPEQPGAAPSWGQASYEARQVYLVDNLSASGALVTGGEFLPVGTRVTGVVEMSGEPPFEISGTVVRRDVRGGWKALALAFDIGNELTIAVFEMALRRCKAKHGGGRPSYVLLLDSDGSSRRALARDIERLGHRCIGINSPLNAISLLDSNEPSFEAVVVDLHLGGLDPEGETFSEFLAENYPWIRRVLISDQAGAGELASAVQSGLAQRMLCKPWSQAQLLAALG